MPNIRLQIPTTHRKPNLRIPIHKIKITILRPTWIMQWIILQPKHPPIGNRSNETPAIISNLILTKWHLRIKTKNIILPIFISIR